MTSIRHVLEDVATDRYVVPMDIVLGLELALDALLALGAADQAETG